LERAYKGISHLTVAIRVIITGQFWFQKIDAYKNQIGKFFVQNNQKYIGEID
jgi:hypothetical protein